MFRLVQDSWYTGQETILVMTIAMALVFIATMIALKVYNYFHKSD